MRLTKNKINEALVILERGRYSALQELRELDRMAKEKKYNGVPIQYIPITKFEDKTANGLTNCIIKWLNLNSHYATRITTTGRKLKDVVHTNIIGQNKVIPGKWIPGTTRTGTADIHAIIHGKHCSIEVKIGADRMSPAQKQTRDDIERAGGFYAIATSFEDFMRTYKTKLL